MAKILKPVSIFLVLFTFFLVISDLPEIEAQDGNCSLEKIFREIEARDGDYCFKEYGGDVGLSYCAPEIYPSFCYTRCRENKGAKGGRCDWGESGDVKCLCDYCHYRDSESRIMRD